MTTTTTKLTTMPVPGAELMDAANRWMAQLTAEPSAAVATAAAAVDEKTAAVVDLAAYAKGQANKYTRPNGEDYMPRKVMIDGQISQDVIFVRKAFDNRMPLLFFGAPGCGKTALVEAALDGLVTIQGTLETEVADFVGSWAQQTDGTYRWVDGPLAIAADTGKPLLIDEVALIDPRVMAVVYGLMDGRDELVVTANPERGNIKVKDGFCVFGACNPDVPGAVMSDALLSRFKLHIEMTTDWGVCKTLGVRSEIVTVARNLHKRKGSAELMAAPQIRELLTFEQTAKVFGLDIALRNFVAQARPEDRHHYESAIKDVFKGHDNVTMLTF
jgi:hypothetical protein